MEKIANLFFILLLTLPTLITADGCIHIEDPELHGWRLQEEKQQLCAINYKEGYQKMILSVDFSGIEGQQRGVWLLPVPASPDETVIDLVKGFPNLWGTDVNREVDKVIYNIFSLSRLSQIYTFPEFLFTLFFSNIGSARNYLGREGLGGTIDGVTIHEHIEKYGVTAELVSTTNGEALYRHLGNKGLEFPQETKNIIDEYVGDDYSFVLAWFSGDDLINIDQYGGYYYKDDFTDSVSLSLKFPTDKIYYPLKPTSVYGSKEVPALIYVMDHITPNLYGAIKTDTEVTYFIDNIYSPSDELSDFFYGQQKIQNLRYTKIKISAPSKYLSEDLWIENKSPNKIKMAVSIIENPISLGIIIFLLISILASLISGLLVFRKYEPSWIKFGLFGLFNSLTIIGFGIASHLLKIDKKFTKKGGKAGKRVEFKKVFKRSFIISLIIFGSFGWLGLHSLFFAPIQAFLMLLITFVFIYLFVFPFVWGYYKNRKINTFIICFSITFVIITILIEVLLHYFF
jgi:hypothetical protein